MGMGVVSEERAFEWNGGAFGMIFIGCLQRQSWESHKESNQSQLFAADCLIFYRPKVHELVLVFIVAAEFQIGNL